MLAYQYPKPRVAYRLLRQAPKILVWWRDGPPLHLAELLTLVRGTYGSGPLEGS